MEGLTQGRYLSFLGGTRECVNGEHNAIKITSVHCSHFERPRRIARRIKLDSVRTRPASSYRTAMDTERERENGVQEERWRSMSERGEVGPESCGKPRRYVPQGERHRCPI
ncbi:hypothetical protein SKAU_G00297640 [Synaphobranchus kaupii]|uniref:Uncharacterized protein n=1 Tax=Synaphobranchus kaupii TaxID=118154 RepID=A0A9Q1EV37_SYNKA|nr:hypothetical protein SKAU_G00297640 [Synaphobranchus kaupii]